MKIQNRYFLVPLPIPRPITNGSLKYQERVATFHLRLHYQQRGDCVAECLRQRGQIRALHGPRTARFAPLRSHNRLLAHVIASVWWQRLITRRSSERVNTDNGDKAAIQGWPDNGI